MNVKKPSVNGFRDIAFGYVSAEAERSHDPGLLLEGYVDLGDASEKALKDHRYLFLGHKGAGKSAMAERIKLMLDGNPHAFVKLVSLSDFPFTPIFENHPRKRRARSKISNCLVLDTAHLFVGILRHR